MPSVQAPNMPPYITRPPSQTASIFQGCEVNSWPTSVPWPTSTRMYSARAPSTTPIRIQNVTREKRSGSPFGSSP